MTFDGLQVQLCDIQGRLFVRSAAEGLDSEAFAQAFMEGPVGEAYYLPYDRTQWMGDGYLLDEVCDDAGGIPCSDAPYDDEALYWMGYTYCAWHFITGETSAQIYRIADAPTMNKAYPGLHTIAVELAIENLRELQGITWSEIAGRP